MMLRQRRFGTLLILTALLVCVSMTVGAAGSAAATPQTTADLPDAGAFAQVNGIKMYYETYGEGEPLLLITSDVGSAGEFATVIPAFVEAGYQAIALDCRGGGRSDNSGQPLSYALMASDIVALMDELGIEKAHIVGQSDGGIIGLHMAIYYPERVDRLVAYGANFNTNGLTAEFKDMVTNITLADFDAMFGDSYRQLAPDPDYLPVLLEQIRHMFLTQPDFTLEQLMSIQSPVLVFDGEQEDTVRIEHARQLAAAIPNSAQVILPDTGHYLMYEDPETYLEYAISFLDGTLDAPPDGKYAAINDIAMYYEIHGEGEPLLLIHGAIGSTEDFSTVIPAFLDAGYQTIAIDCRGRGLSTDSG